MRSSNPPLASRQQEYGLAVGIGSSGKSKRKITMPKKNQYTMARSNRNKRRLDVAKKCLSVVGEDVQIANHPNQKQIFNLLWAAEFIIEQARGLV